MSKFVELITFVTRQDAEKALHQMRDLAAEHGGELFLSELNQMADSPGKRTYNDGYKDGYKDGYIACAKKIGKKFEEMLAQMKKELEEAEV